MLACEPDRIQTPEHKIVARVNNDVLSTDHLEQILAQYNSDISHNDTKQKFVKQWISNTVIYQEALKSGYTLSETDKFRIAQLQKDLIIRQYLNNRMKEIEILDNDILMYYQTHKEEFKREENEIRLAHFFLDSKEIAISEYLKTTKDLLATIKKFHLEKTKDGMVINGDLGYQKETEINTAFLKRITIPKKKRSRRNRKKSYKDGDIVGPIKISGRYHFIQVLDRKKAGTYYSVEHVKDIIKERLLLMKMDDENKNIIEAIKSKYIIVNNLNKGL